MKSSHKHNAKRTSVMEKPFLEQVQKTKSPESASSHHTIFGVHAHDQVHVNRLKHTDPELWNRIRSWN